MGADLTKEEMIKYEIEQLEGEEIEINKQLRDLQLRLNQLVPKKDKVKVKELEAMKPITDPTQIDKDELQYEPQTVIPNYFNNDSDLSQQIDFYGNNNNEEVKSNEEEESKKSASQLSSSKSESDSGSKSSDSDSESKSVQSSSKHDSDMKELKMDSIANYKDDIESNNGVPMRRNN